MEKTTLISANGHPYEREIPKIIIHSYMNDVSLSNLRKQTGIDFKANVHGQIEGQPDTWEQMAKIFLTYNFLTHDQNNWDGNVLHLQGAFHVPLGQNLYYEQDGKKFAGVSGWRG